MLVPNRHEASESYRYGFNGMEMDNELKGGEGNGINYDKRFYDPRIGRFLSIDPLEKSFPWYTPYQFAGNTPIQAIDLDGAEEYHYTLKIVKGKTHFILTNTKTHNHVVLLWGLIDRYYKIPVKKYLVTHEKTKYYIGFAGTYGSGNQDKAELFELFRDSESHWTLNDFKESFNSEGQSNNMAMAQTAVNLQNNTLMYGPINGKAWYTPRDYQRGNSQINSRHYLSSDAIAKAKKTAPATMAPRAILDADIEAYNTGEFRKLKGGDVLINGRTYSTKNEGKTLYPKSGGAKEFIDLSQGQIKAIQLIKTVPRERLDAAVKGSKISNEDYKFAQDFVKKY